MSASEPLAEIRRIELEMASQLEEARQAATDAVAAAREDARRRVREAAERGRDEAGRRYRATVDQAERDAEHIRTEGSAAARRLRNEAGPQVPAAAAVMFELVLAPPAEEGV